MNTETIISAAVLIFLGFIFWKLLSRKKPPEEILPYRKKYLLTKHEWAFYKKLKPVADMYGLNVIAKIRFADLVEVDTGQTKEFIKFFSKISSKHIDFGLVNPENMEVEYLIELDDRSHERPDRIERDRFVNAVCKKAGYVLIHTYNEVDEIERIISNNINNTENSSKRKHKKC